MGLPLIDMPTEVCKEYVEAKQHWDSFNKDAWCRTKCHLKVVHSNVCGMIQVDSIGGNGYFGTSNDVFSRKLWTYLIKRKNEVLEVFKKFKSVVERQNDHKIKTLGTSFWVYSMSLWSWMEWTATMLWLYPKGKIKKALVESHWDPLHCILECHSIWQKLKGANLDRSLGN